MENGGRREEYSRELSRKEKVRGKKKQGGGGGRKKEERKEA